MKVAIITDQHLDGRKGNLAFWNYFQKFYDDVFFPVLEKEKITTVFDLGDTFDNRKSLDYNTFNRVKINYFEKLKKYKVHMILGNHCTYYKNTNKINSPELLLENYENISIYSSPEHISVGGKNFLMMPWINSGNKKEAVETMKSSNADIMCSHMEVDGFEVTPGMHFDGGFSVNDFKNFDRVWSGHFHHRSKRGNVQYLGNPYEMFWNDVNDTRGFHFFDTETCIHTPVNNPYQLFHNVYYEDTPYQLFDATLYKGKIVKVIVRKKSNPKEFERFVDKLYSAGVEDLKIIENFDIQVGDEFDIDEDENTLSILNRYIDDSDFEYDKNIIKNIFKDLYRQACEVE